MRIAPFMAATATLAICLSAPAEARQYAAGSLRISDGWTRATAAAGSSAVGYLTITNDGSTPERLTGADCPIAASTSLHSETNADGVMQMRPVAGIDIAPGETLKLTPGGLHLMLVGTKQKLVRGTTITCRLDFRNTGRVEVEFLVRSAGATEPLMGPMETK